MKTVADIASAGNNSFGLVRLMAAMAVVVSHGYLIVEGVSAFEPLERFTGYPLGAHAVHVFFTVSGLLVAASIERRPGLVPFGAARFFRIYPGLLAATVILFVLCASFLSAASWGEIASRSGMDYFARILIAFAGSSTIPGVFEGLPNSGEVNVPIWTLKYEIICYVSLALAMAAVAWSRRITPLAAALAIVAISAAWLLQGKAYDEAGFLDHVARFSFAFWSGVATWHLRDIVPLRAVILAALFALTSTSIYLRLPITPHALMLLSGYLAVFVAQYRFGRVSAFTDRNDLSYGTYIYGWPLQQTLLLAFPAITGLQNGLLALVVLLPVAYLSWRFVEKPALRMKDRFV